MPCKECGSPNVHATSTACIRWLQGELDLRRSALKLSNGEIARHQRMIRRLRDEAKARTADLVAKGDTLPYLLALEERIECLEARLPGDAAARCGE